MTSLDNTGNCLQRFQQRIPVGFYQFHFLIVKLIIVNKNWRNPVKVGKFALYQYIRSFSISVSIRYGLWIVCEQN